MSHMAHGASGLLMTWQQVQRVTKSVAAYILAGLVDRLSATQLLLPDLEGMLVDHEVAEEMIAAIQCSIALVAR